MNEKYYPKEASLGKNCQFWDFNGRFAGCNFPRAEMEGRTSCEGVIDETCLFLKDRRPSENVDMEYLKLKRPALAEKSYIPTDRPKVA